MYFDIPIRSALHDLEVLYSSDDYRFVRVNIHNHKRGPTAAQRTQNKVEGQSAAAPRPALVWEPESSNFEVNKAMPEAAARSSWVKNTADSSVSVAPARREGRGWKRPHGNLGECIGDSAASTTHRIAAQGRTRSGGDSVRL
jgi:hypothetical protein